MKTRPLFWKLLTSYLLLILLILSVATGWFLHTLKNFHLQQTLVDLRDQAALIKEQVRPLLKAEDFAALPPLAATLGAKTGTRITLILPNGRVIADSHEKTEALDNHGDRPELIDALTHGIGKSVRHSDSLHTSMLYVASPIRDQATLLAIIRTAKPLQGFRETVALAYPGILLGSLAVALAAALLSLLVSCRISRPLERIKRAAEKFAEGHLKKKIVASGPAEVVSLAETLNLMAERLQNRIDTVISQRNEQEAVLSSMVEGVVAVDGEERILRINEAGRKLLSISEPNPKGKPIQEVVRKADLLRFIRHTLADGVAIESEILIQTEADQIRFQVHGMPLKDPKGQPMGALVVLNDVSRLRRLEKIRSDFVANVSHELKTPITAIKGFVETLQEGAIDHPEEGRRFLAIIAKQVERLNAIIEDLLRLSRLEQDEKNEAILLEKNFLNEVLNAAIFSCSSLAAEKSVRIELECPPDLLAEINPPLLEQAIINLINNAVQYSAPESRILVRAASDPQGVQIRVRDWGIGIGEEHHGRIFERFYRADPARSRKLGGTGLGLAIVKHIAQIHHGAVGVESAPGKGSTFTLTLPRSANRL